MPPLLPLLPLLVSTHHFKIDRPLGLIVSNAQAELLDWYERNPDGNVYLANSAYAGGILEGLSYFNLLP